MILGLSIVYGVIALLVICGATADSLQEGKIQHVPQPTTGIYNLLVGILWPLALLLLGFLTVFDSGQPKPIQDPVKKAHDKYENYESPFEDNLF